MKLKNERDFFHLFGNKSSSSSLFFTISYFSILRYGTKNHCTSQIIGIVHRDQITLYQCCCSKIQVGVLEDGSGSSKIDGR